MTTTLSRWLVAILFVAQPGCSLNPAWLFDDYTDYDKKRGKMLDTRKNRQRSFDIYADHARREAAGENVDWELVWRGIFTALREGHDNPDVYTNFIISERRKYGLPDLPFAE